ncbi:MAG: site-specific DNA-methyltransferase [Deltaproteobacteria bacterium]|nr:site-specific DNA-methyltransferase [Deltaproteobacteria bacterium]
MDCIQGMSELNDSSVDVVVTSPPYNLGIGYSRYRDDIPRQEYLEWTNSWIGQVARVMKRQGSFFLNVSGSPTDPWLPFQVLEQAGRHLKLQNVIHWVKSIAIDRGDMGNYQGRPAKLAVGHYKPINSNRFLNDAHEYIFHLTKAGTTKLNKLAIGVEYTDQSNKSRWKNAGKGLRGRGNVWFIPYKTIRMRAKDRPHPATFPVKLPRMCIQLHDTKGTDMVLDPFLGLGSTALACIELDVPFLGFEIDEVYFKETQKRIESQLAKTMPFDFKPES